MTLRYNVSSQRLTSGFRRITVSAGLCLLLAPSSGVQARASQPLPVNDGYKVLWGLDQIDQRTRALNNLYTYDHTGKGVTVYLVDSGVNASHRELRGRIAPGHSVLADHPTTDDCTGHGTGIASVIAGRTYGVAKGVTIVPVRIFGCSNLTTTENIEAGIRWMIEHHQPGQPAVANLSFGNEQGSDAIDAVVREAIADGIHVVVSAGGRSGGDACSASPGRVDEAIVVGAVDRRLRKTAVSSYGPCVDIWAPGAQIVAARHDSDRLNTVNTSTSIATPFAVGAVALILEEFGNASIATAEKLLKKNATVGVLKGIGVGSPNRLLYTSTGDRRVEVGKSGKIVRARLR